MIKNKNCIKNYIPWGIILSSLLMNSAQGAALDVKPQTQCARMEVITSNYMTAFVEYDEEVWFPGEPSESYSLKLINQCRYPVMAFIAVDNVDVLNGQKVRNKKGEPFKSDDAQSEEGNSESGQWSRVSEGFELMPNSYLLVSQRVDEKNQKRSLTFNKFQESKDTHTIINNKIEAYFYQIKITDKKEPDKASDATPGVEASKGENKKINNEKPDSEDDANSSEGQNYFSYKGQFRAIKEKGEKGEQNKLASEKASELEKTQVASVKEPSFFDKLSFNLIHNKETLKNKNIEQIQSQSPFKIQSYRYDSRDNLIDREILK